MQLPQYMFNPEVVVLEGGKPSGYSSVHLLGVLPECEVCHWHLTCESSG